MSSDAAQEPKPITVTEMIDVTYAEGSRIRASQEALVKAGVRQFPYQPELRRAEVFEATSRFLERIQPHLKEVRQLIERAAKSKAR